MWCPEKTISLEKVLEHALWFVFGKFVAFYVEAIQDFELSQVLNFWLVWLELVHDVSVIFGQNTDDISCLKPNSFCQFNGLKIINSTR